MKKSSTGSRQLFQKYADLYDLFYAEKDYRKESRYVLDLLTKHLGKKPRSILDLGCGTGGHALIWSSKRIAVTGLDRSEVMLKHAVRKATEQRRKIRFVQGDVRSFALGKKFDAVTAMFAVMSYQTTREDILSAFRSVRKHLRSGGVFLFDAWFGPGVFADPPGDRVKTFQRDGMEVLRTVKAVHRVEEQLVEVHYDILLLEGKRVIERVQEIHPMHYFFPQEVVELAAEAGFVLIESHPFLSKEESLRVSDWNAAFVLRGK